MEEFKFNCPKCGQHILAKEEWAGRQITCPSCDTRITIPSPEKPRKKTQPVQAREQPSGQAAHGVRRISLPAKKTGPIETRSPAPQSPAPKPPNEAAAKPASPAPPQNAAAAPPVAAPVRIAVLTPTLKREMVRAVRRRIADASAWIPGKLNGRNAYAAQAHGETPVLVDVKSPEAARFSLMGAFLLELHQRRIARTAFGRTRFLDQEIPDAAREVLFDAMSEEEREHTEDPLAKTDLMSLSHGQCLAVLDVLDQRYSQRVDQAGAEQMRRRIGDVRMADLVAKLEKKAPIAGEDVAAVLYHELMDLRRRLDRLENRLPRRD